MFNLRQLKAYITVVENKSFTRAAKILFMTQPAISAQIKSLEDRLDVQLIERNDKNVIMTDAGEMFYIEAQKIMSLYDGFVEAVNDLKGVRRGKLFLAASTIPGDYIIPKFIGGFKQIYPGIDISLKISDTGLVAEQLNCRTADIGILGAAIKLDTLQLEEFIKDEMILIGPVGKEESQQEISLEDLLESSFVLREQNSGTRMAFAEKIKEKGIDPKKLKVIMELGSTRAIITAVENGLGISVVSRIAAKNALELGKIREIRIKDMSLHRSLYLAWNKNKYHTYAFKAFLNYLQSQKDQELRNGAKDENS
jgi:DNA-binding transcriptional LysR family regulator